MANDNLPGALLDALDDQLGSLPRKTGHSRARFYRLFQALSAESPGAMRRRLPSMPPRMMLLVWS